MRLRHPAMVLLAAALFIPADDELPPPEVTPAATPGGPPSDAIVLFDGNGASEWIHADGRSADWPVFDGALTVRSGSGDLYSRRRFGSAQIHIEFAVPDMPEASGQAKGNSGVYLHARYEIQVLDSFRNPTYPNGSAGAVYGQYPPLVNASRRPGEWQSYDIIFHAPRCAPEGHITQPATLTLLHNGVLVQDHVAIQGNTGGGSEAGACEPGPLMLQDHAHPDVKETALKFRNIWYRPLQP